MTFTEIYSYRISDKEYFKKDVSVRQFEDKENQKSFYFDIRTKFLNEKREILPTKRGVVLKPCEFEELMPYMLNGQTHEIDGEYRRIWFTKREDKPYVHQLKLLKMDGKETSIDLLMTEIKKLNFIKDKLFNKAK